VQLARPSWRWISPTKRCRCFATLTPNHSVRCEIIRRDIHADAVAITNIDHVLAYVGVGEHNYRDNDDTVSPTTRQALTTVKSLLKTMMRHTGRLKFTPCW
jgi:LytS/YehU family sensor histidine kinase